MEFILVKSKILAMLMLVFNDNGQGQDRVSNARVTNNET